MRAHVGLIFFFFSFFSQQAFSFTRRRHITTSGEMREESAHVMSRHVATRCFTPVWQRVLRPRRVVARTPGDTNPLLLSSFFSDNNNNVTYVETFCNKHCVLKTHALLTQLWNFTPHFTSHQNCGNCFDTVPVIACPGILAWQMEGRLFVAC